MTAAEQRRFVYELSTRYSAPVLAKARNLIAHELVQRDEKYTDIWWAWGSDPDRPYRIQLGRNPSYPEEIAYVTCTCAHGLYVGAGDCLCSHSAAVLFMLEEELNLNQRLAAVEVEEVETTKVVRPRGNRTRKPTTKK